MNYKLLLGILLSAIFYFWSFVAYYIFGIEIVLSNFWANLLIDLCIMIFLFSVVSLFRTIAFKKHFEGQEIYQITGAFIVSVLIFRIAYGIFTVQPFPISIIEKIGFVLYLSIREFTIYGSELLIASYFLNIFQSFSSIKSKLSIPLIYQIRVTMGLVVALAAISLIFYLIFHFTVSEYGTTIPFSLLIVVPTVVSIYLMRKPSGGFKLNEKNHPEFFNDLKEIADSMGVSTPKEVFITPTNEIAVSGVLKKRMILGIATLDKLKKSELKSIMAHELGHLYGGDTIIGYIIANIRLSLVIITRYIPSSVFAIIFYLISLAFSFITLAYSRQVEYRADMVAARLFGGKNFSKSLLDYVTYSTFFEQNIPNLIQEVAKEGKMFVNIYEFLGKSFNETKENEIKKDIEKRKTSIWSTHPGTIERIKKIEKVNGLNLVKGAENASEYFKDFPKLQEDATKILSYVYHLQQKHK